jgi:hypothetical protein
MGKLTISTRPFSMPQTVKLPEGTWSKQFWYVMLFFWWKWVKQIIVIGVDTSSIVNDFNGGDTRVIEFGIHSGQMWSRLQGNEGNDGNDGNWGVAIPKKPQSLGEALIYLDERNRSSFYHWMGTSTGCLQRGPPFSCRLVLAKSFPITG